MLVFQICVHAARKWPTAKWRVFISFLLVKKLLDVLKPRLMHIPVEFCALLLTLSVFPGFYNMLYTATHRRLLNSKTWLFKTASIVSFISGSISVSSTSIPRSLVDCPRWRKMSSVPSDPCLHFIGSDSLYCLSRGQGIGLSVSHRVLHVLALKMFTIYYTDFIYGFSSLLMRPCLRLHYHSGMRAVIFLNCAQGINNYSV